MLTILENPCGDVLSVKASGTLTHADYQQFVPKVEVLLEKWGHVRVLFELEDCKGWTLRAALDDLKFGFKHRGHIDRCAVVGEKKWQKWMTNLSRPFFNVKYFDKAQLDKAMQWIQQGVPGNVPYSPCQDDAKMPAAKDLVQETSEESFPASDSPSWTPITGSGPPR